MTRDAAGAKSALSALPVSDTSLDNTYKFLSQVGAFVTSLERQISSGGTISGEQREQLMKLISISQSLSKSISSVIENVEAGEMSLRKSASNIAKSDEQAANIIARSGLDFIGKIKTPEKNYESVGFPEFEVPQKTDRYDSDEEAKPTSDKERAAHFEAMRACLESMNIPPEKKEGLEERIQHKIILSPVQLRADSVKYERFEAGGMDFSGKVHIIEDSIANNCMVELQFGDRIIVGVPISLSKEGSDATVLMRVNPERVDEESLVKEFAVGQAKFVKRIRGSVLR